MSVTCRTVALLISSLALAACSPATNNSNPSAVDATHLKPHPAPLPEPSVRRTVYVPIYSTIYTGLDIGKNMIDLAATLSIRNVSAQRPVVLNFVRYYDSGGTLLHEYVNAPVELGPLASAEFVIKRGDTSGGPGANFLVQWAGHAEVDDPLIEAVMIGLSGNAAISFTSPGRNIRNEPPQ